VIEINVDDTDMQRIKAACAYRSSRIIILGNGYTSFAYTIILLLFVRKGTPKHTTITFVVGTEIEREQTSSGRAQRIIDKNNENFF